MLIKSYERRANGLYKVYIDDDNIIPALHVRLQKSNKDKKELFKKTINLLS